MSSPFGAARWPRGTMSLLSPEMTEGPYWVDERLNRPDIRTDRANGAVQAGTLLTLSITVHSVTTAIMRSRPRLPG
jgi:hypothetical protein